MRYLYVYVNRENKSCLIFEDIRSAIAYLNLASVSENRYNSVESVNMEEYEISAEYKQLVERTLGDSFTSVLNTYNFKKQVDNLRNVSE